MPEKVVVMAEVARRQRTSCDEQLSDFMDEAAFTCITSNASMDGNTVILK